MTRHARPEKRAEKRELFTVTLEYACTSVDDGRLSCFTSSGVSTNLSTSGMGFYTEGALKRGHDLTLYSSKISLVPVNAKVRWCSKLSESLYRVGVSFG